ncbi:MAG: FecR family protein, partial [Lachnospiraceae bacterium]|nr:FecR family protein [Lachnospiraceae bacterium]
MFRRMPSKLWLGIGAAAVVAIVVVIVSVVMKDEPEAYRTINVYEYTGNAQVVRGEDKVIDVYNNMRLESGDKVITGKESYLQLKLDNDKYILLEAETEIKIVAEGTKKDSKTKIELEKGAIVNCIEEKLSGSSEYKIETPNSTMAVRGTTFRVQIETGEDGEVYAAVSVFEGNVASKLIYPDGSVEEKEVDIATGKAVKILGTSADTMYVTIDDEVDYKELELEVLKFLDKSQENGKELSIPKDELKEIIEEIISMNKDENKETESTEEETTSYKEEETTTVKQTTTQQTTSQSTT